MSERYDGGLRSLKLLPHLRVEVGAHDVLSPFSPRRGKKALRELRPALDILVAGSILGEFPSVSNGTIDEDWMWKLDYGLDGSSVTAIVSAVSDVHLPAAAWLFISAIAGLAGAKRLSRSKASA